MSDEDFRDKARRTVPETWRVDDLAQVMKPAGATGAWVSVWMWVEESGQLSLPFTALERERMRRYGEEEANDVHE